MQESLSCGRDDSIDVDRGSGLRDRLRAVGPRILARHGGLESPRGVAAVDGLFAVAAS